MIQAVIGRVNVEKANAANLIRNPRCDTGDVPPVLGNLNMLLRPLVSASE